ncbi:helix-turn-helix domain-containing protein [Sinorhizobium chiapasense]|uniref:helix-turn-helix domain-containing protein n=1 Tax=Sinorhizobium chiapasense TaxID=501572 RepID=UPI0038CD2B5B
MLGITQQLLARHVGVTFQQIQEYENGKNRVSAAIPVRICQAMQISPMEIIGVCFPHEGPTADRIGCRKNCDGGDKVGRRPAGLARRVGERWVAWAWRLLSRASSPPRT